MTRSAVVVVVAAVEQAVALHRRRHDPMLRRGVPPHVTVLHPFRAVVDEATAALIDSIARRTAPFEVTFSEVGRFPDGLVYLVPEPASAFKRLTDRFVELFPDCPPYGGAITDPTPHLTVGTIHDPTTADLVAASLAACVPIAADVDRLTLLVEDDSGQWTISRSWLLTGHRAG